MRICFSIFLLIGLAASQVAAEWGYFRGDIATFPASNTSGGIAESIHQAVNSGLDWVVLSTPPGTGSFVGQNEIVEEIKLTLPRLTPILATGWKADGLSARVLGVDARAPIARNLDVLLETVEAHGGLAVLDDNRKPLSSDAVACFSPVSNGQWTSAVDPGGIWDQALSRGRRVFIAASSLGNAPAHTHQTTVWSEGNHADQIIRALREGSSYVSDTDGIQLDFRVDGRTLAQTVFHSGEPFVRIRAHSKHPISSVSLIADGQEIWSASPQATVWEERFFLPAEDFAYVRAVLTSDEGGYRTLSNPIFLVTENAGEGEIPLDTDSDIRSPEDFIELGGVIEALSGLGSDAQSRILREFLADPATRYSTCWLLQNRSDVVSDHLLAEIARDDLSVESRLGSAYALVTRGSDLAPDVLLTYLDSRDPALQRYGARIFAHYTEGFTEDDWTWNPDRHPEAAAYLIRAYHPTRFESTDIQNIIGVLTRSEPALSDAASDKLVDLGTRHYKVIEALLEASTAGLKRAVDILGIIADHRTVGPLQRIYNSAAAPELRRSLFLALSSMGAPYPDRPTFELPSLDAAPVVDGVATQSEWDTASRLPSLRLDWDGREAREASQVMAGTYADSVYFMVTLSGPSPAATITDADIIPPDNETLELAFSAPPVPGARTTPSVSLIAINPAGITRGDLAANCRAATVVSAASWSIEMAIPADVFSDRPRFNLSVVTGSAPTDRVTWSTTYGSPGNPDRFGDILLARTK